MIKKIIFFISSFLFLSNCGFSPLYSVNKVNDINIEVLSYEGDREINLDLISKLKFHKNSNGKLYKVNINTKYKKTTLTKNLAGETEEYQLQSNTTFTIISDNLEEQFNANTRFTMKNLDDDFEEKNYEKTIKKNISNLIYNRLIAQISKTK
tara:strand:+ start:346 stop:801 length:456 start_codon:yes stop_codon:yes gene_type:complete